MRRALATALLALTAATLTAAVTAGPASAAGAAPNGLIGCCKR